MAWVVMKRAAIERACVSLIDAAHAVVVVTKHISKNKEILFLITMENWLKSQQ
jgi:hypothetical protein